jgi:hypothetical protein
VGGYFYLGNKKPQTSSNPTLNGPIHIESIVMKNVMAAASEAEIGALFHKGQETAHICNVLREIGHAQLEPTQMRPLTTPQQTVLPTKGPKSGDPRPWT